MSNVIISADGVCDIGEELKEKYDIKLLNWRIELEGEEYVDGMSISPDDIYDAWRQRKVLPKSTGGTPIEYYEFFKGIYRDGCEIVHINLGSSLSSSYQNCLIAAAELGYVYTVDSQNLSSGMGQLVIEAALMAEDGKTAAEIQAALNGMCERAHASFLLDTLEFMKAGGRCNSITALGANMLKIKPCVEVDNQNGGSMHLGKKYRGNMDKALQQYVQDKLEGRDDIDTRRIFITHSGSPDEDIEVVRQEIGKYQQFDNIYVTKASTTISTHCGPRTLGILFMTKQEGGK